MGNDKTLFDGEHLQKILWHFIVPDSKSMVQHVNHVIKNGVVVYRTQINNAEYSAITLPNKMYIRVMLLFKEKKLISLAPLLLGSHKATIIDEMFTWDAPNLGEITLRPTCTEYKIQIFDPFYAVDAKQKMNRYGVRFSCICTQIEKFEDKSWTVNHGGFYDVALAKFLEMHPNKTKEDFGTPTLHMTKDLRYLLPTKYTSVHDLMASVEQVIKTQFLGTSLYILNACLTKPEDRTKFNVFLYVNEEILEGYIPQEGDVISARAWFLGYFDFSKDRSKYI